MTQRAHWPVFTVVLFAVAAVLMWNASRQSWLQGYDAWAAQRYAQVITEEHRLPRVDETDIWHNPPVFFAIAGQLERLGERLGLEEREDAVQLFSAVCVLGIIGLTYLLARELFPDRRSVWLLALFLAASTPVLVRAGSLYHPEPFATALTTAGLFVTVRALRRGLGWWPGLGAGVLLSLACLTRAWAMAAVAAVVVAVLIRWVRTRDRAALRTVAAVVALFVVAVGPWLGYKAVEFGTPFAYSQPNPEQWPGPGRPASFWIGVKPLELLETPYQPSHRNVLVAVLHADWWGDYWRTWRVPAELRDEPAQLPAEYARPLRTQALFGLVLGAAAIAGVILLVVRAWRERDEALGAVLLSLVFLAATYVAFLVRYPKMDGDNIKALYVLNAAPVVAIAGAWALARFAAGGRLQLASVALALAVATYATVTFLVLPS